MKWWNHEKVVESCGKVIDTQKSHKSCLPLPCHHNHLTSFFFCERAKNPSIQFACIPAHLVFVVNVEFNYRPCISRAYLYRFIIIKNFFCKSFCVDRSRDLMTGFGRVISIELLSSLSPNAFSDVAKNFIMQKMKMCSEAKKFLMKFQIIPTRHIEVKR